MELGTNCTTRGVATKPSFDEGDDDDGEIAGFWGYLLQIIYQVKEAATPPNALKYHPLGNPFQVSYWRGTSASCTYIC
jgi:hypothetical protein